MYGLLGKKLGHSFSKEIHNLIGGYEYRFYEVEKENIKDFMQSGIEGFNVTIPYKMKIMKYLDEISDKAKKIGCVNTVVRRGDKWIGDNTDYFGFKYTLHSFKTQFKKALILGDGATSKTIETVLADQNISYTKLSRKIQPYYSQVGEFVDVDLIVNTTPVGMYPNNGEKLIELEQFKNVQAVIDVVYNPFITSILFDAKRKNIPYSNGLKMLVAQAIEASKIFTGVDSNDKIEEIISKLEKKKNIILIGMPGSGKSTVARIMAEKTNRKFVDLDSEVKRKTNRTIDDIFENEGEEKFREIESELCEEFGKKNNLIISTGGGVITKERNYEPLKQNGIIYLLDRKLDELNIDGRPLSKSYGTAEELWQKRKNGYLKFADKIIKKDNSKIAAEQILGDFYENTCD